MKNQWISVTTIVLIIISCSPSSQKKDIREDSGSEKLGDLYVTVFQEYKKAEAELDKLYTQILEEYSDEPLFKTKLEKAELAWIDFRDAQLDFLFQGELEVPEEINSSIQYWLSMKELTESRISLIRIWLLEFNRVGSSAAGE